MTNILKGEANKNALSCDTQIDKTPDSNNFAAYGAFIQYIEREHQCSGIGYE